jgi:hypothetical protein
MARTKTWRKNSGGKSSGGKAPRKKLGEAAKKQPPAAPAAPATGCVTGVEADVIDLSGEPIAASAGAAAGTDAVAAAAAAGAADAAGSADAAGPVLSDAQRAHDETMTELREKVEAARRALHEYAGSDSLHRSNLSYAVTNAEYVLRTHFTNRVQVFLSADPKGRFMGHHSGWFGTEAAVEILLGRRGRLVHRGAGMLVRAFTDTLNEDVRQKMKTAAVGVGQQFTLKSPLSLPGRDELLTMRRCSDD